MEKIDNSTKGWGNVLKPQDQAETPIVIQSREMKLENPAALKQELDKIIKQSDNLFLTGDFYSTPIHETRMAEAARHAPLSDSDYAEKELRAEADAKVEKAIHDRFEELMKESEKEEQSRGIKR